MRGLWCPACRSKKKCQNSVYNYEIKSNIFEDKSKILPDKRQIQARDFYWDQEFEGKSDTLPQRQYPSRSKTLLLHEQAENLEICPVKKQTRKVQKIKDLEMEQICQRILSRNNNQSMDGALTSYKDRIFYRQTQKVTSYIQQIAQGDSQV